MKKNLIFGMLLVLLITTAVVTTVIATTDNELNTFFNMYSSNFQITTIWAGEAVTPSGQVAKLAIVNLKWTDNEGNTFQERRFYANFQGSASDVIRHFSDAQKVTTLINYPSGTCEQKAPDGSCGVKSFTFMYAYDSTSTEFSYHRFNIDVDPATGQATGGVVKELVTDATYTGKADIEDSPPNIKNTPSTLTFTNQNGIISEDTTTVNAAINQ